MRNLYIESTPRIGDAVGTFIATIELELAYVDVVLMFIENDLDYVADMVLRMSDNHKMSYLLLDEAIHKSGVIPQGVVEALLNTLD